MNRFLFVFTIFLPAMVFAQSSKFNFKLGTEYELPRKTSDLAFVGNQQDGIVNLSLKKEELIRPTFILWGVNQVGVFEGIVPEIILKAKLGYLYSIM